MLIQSTAPLFANGFSTGPQHTKAWETERQRVQRIRGEILSAVFEVESSVDYAIGNCVLPRTTIRSPGSLVKRHDLFQNEILTHFDFRKKIEIMDSLLRERFPRRKKHIAKLVSLMNRIRDVRNRMAHSPVYFEALERPISGRWLRPHLMTPKGMIHLSDGYLREFRENSLEAIKVLRQLMRLGIRQKPSKIEIVWRLTNRSSQPLTVAMSRFNFMKQFPMFATLAAASGGSAPSR